MYKKKNIYIIKCSFWIFYTHVPLAVDHLPPVWGIHGGWTNQDLEVHGCETLKMDESDKKKLDIFQTKCLLKKNYEDQMARRNFKQRSLWKNWYREDKWRSDCQNIEMDWTYVTSLTWHTEGKRKVSRKNKDNMEMNAWERTSLGWNSWDAARTVWRKIKLIGRAVS